MIQIFSNSLGDEELAAVKRLFASRWVGKGKETDAFEAEFGEHLGRGPRPLMTNSGTAAIYLVLRALGIGRGDQVVIPAIQFVACASAVIDLGAEPVFADVCPRTLCITPGEVMRRCVPGRTKAVLLLHYGGHAARMDEIKAMAGPWVKVIEDTANAPASRYHGAACGTLGDAGIWSFDAMKILVTVDGGMLWLRGEEARERALALRNLGLAPKTTSGMDSYLDGRRSRWWEFDLVATSGSFISNDVAAAIGRIQLRKLLGFVSRRREIWEVYQRELAVAGDLLLPPEPAENTTSSYYLYWVQTGRRDELATYLAENGVYTTFRYYPLHQVRYFGSTARLPNAERAAETTLCLPLHQNLSDSDVAEVIDRVKEFYR